jgi:hypothetical protein
MHDTIKGPMNIPKARCLQDVFLMDSFVAMGLEGDDLRLLNDMRMYKQVIHLSDITSADGQVILKSFLDGSRPTHPSPYRWPRCYKPSAYLKCTYGRQLSWHVTVSTALNWPTLLVYGWLKTLLNLGNGGSLRPLTVSSNFKMALGSNGTPLVFNIKGIAFSALPSSLTLYLSLQ